MERLLTDDTPENRVRAYSHYHLVVESVLAQTGYWGITSTMSPGGSDEVATSELPHLEGLVEGVSHIRSDEGRHAGFGMRKVQHHLAEDDVAESVVRETLQELMPLVEYAREKLTRRVEIITDREADVPDVERLVALDGRDAAAD